MSKGVNMTKLSKKKIYAWISKNALVIIGTIILAFGSAVFLVPFNLVMGGTSGIAVIIKSIFSDGTSPETAEMYVNIAVAVITWSLFFIGLVFLGKDFAAKTLLSTIVYPLAFPLLSKLASPGVVPGDFFYLKGSEHEELALVFAGVMGGILLGAGCAIAFLGGGTTGGTDIIAFLIGKFFPKLKISEITFFVDFTIIILGIFAVNDLILSGIGVLSAYVSSMVIDKIFLGGTTAYVAHIVTTTPDEISRDVIKILDRTTTIMDCKGAYSGENKNVVMVSFTMREYREIISIVSKYDKKAFITVNKAHEISGEGW
jgi:uncharacterized membrane-anchored protein YitT (DUF2179 family)